MALSTPSSPERTLACACPPLRIVVSVLVLLAAAVTVAPAADPIHIALSGPMTGNYAEYGQNFQRSVDLAVEWINAAGGVNGRPLAVITGDSKGDPKEAAALA